MQWRSKGLAAIIGCIGSLTPATAAEVDPRFAAVFESLCIKTFPDHMPSAAALAAFGAEGDDPAAAAHPMGNGMSYRSWTIAAPAEGRHGMEVRTRLGERFGAYESGCYLRTNGHLQPAVVEKLLAALPGAARTSSDAPAVAELDIRRWIVRLGGRGAVLSVAQTNAAWKGQPYSVVTLAQYPREVTDLWRQPPQ